MKQISYIYANEVENLFSVLKLLHDRDPDQELRGDALKVYDSVIESAKIYFKNDETILSLSEGFSAENIGLDNFPRVADCLVVMTQIWSAIGTGRSLSS